jgi:hypothetical protein
MTTDHSDIRNLCARITVPQAAAMAGIDIPADGKRFASPFRVDRSPSCTATAELFSDWSRDQHLDAVGVYGAARGLNTGQAYAELKERLQIGAPTVVPKRDKPTKTLVVPPLTREREKMRALAELRGVDFEAVELAVLNLKTVGFCRKFGLDCWAVTDSAHRIVELRRMDGGKFPPLPPKLDERKTHSLGGSKKHHPVGIASAVKFPADFPALLVEGSGDYLAAVGVATTSKVERVPVAMLGTNDPIGDHALPWFRGRDVVILAHNDTAGLKARKRWKEQLDPLCRVRSFVLEGGDLNDLVKQHGAAAVAEGLGL